MNLLFLRSIYLFVFTYLSICKKYSTKLSCSFSSKTFKIKFSKALYKVSIATMNNLPVILISAANATASTALISELIDNDVTVEYTNNPESQDRVWRLVNKYYTADVRVHTLTDDQQLNLDPECVEAQVIYITQEELESGVEHAERRSGACVSWVREEIVRSVVAECATEEEAAHIGAWAQRPPRALLVARGEGLLPPAHPALEPFAEALGLQRLRDALHAHLWPNLTRTDGGDAQLPPQQNYNDVSEDESEDSEEGEWGSWRSWGGCVGNDDLVLQRLVQAMKAVRAMHANGAESRAVRLARAQGMLREVCRAQHTHPATLDD